MDPLEQILHITGMCLIWRSATNCFELLRGEKKFELLKLAWLSERHVVFSPPCLENPLGEGDFPPHKCNLDYILVSFSSDPDVDEFDFEVYDTEVEWNPILKYLERRWDVIWDPPRIPRPPEAPRSDYAWCFSELISPVGGTRLYSTHWQESLYLYCRKVLKLQVSNY